MAVDFTTRLASVSVPDSETSQITVSPTQAFRGDQGASELLGQINRAQWDDWRNRFAPYISALADIADDPQAASQAAENAQNAMGLAYDVAEQSEEQRRQAYGVDQTAAQKATNDRMSNLSRVADTVTAGNQARISAQDRQSAILAGGLGLSNVPDQVLNN
ncbi:hypothetical protein ACSEE7_12705 [Halomonas cupida]|uniref:hypothetical protein n=1 Tax=Halomonas cupida TaxID=44933 RepID=UPI003EF61C2C